MIYKAKKYHDMNRFHIVKMLVDAGVNINAQDYEGQTAFHYAMDNWDIAQLLIENSADVNKEDERKIYTPLCFAAYNGNVEVVKVLLEAGTDVNKLDKDKHTPLYYAAHNGHAMTVRLLEDAMRKKTKNEQAIDRVQNPVVQTGANQPHTQDVNATPIRISHQNAKTQPYSSKGMTFVHTKED